ncbi:MAG: sigma-70 family RNA polymerase sigma factor [Acidobacteria bacterium]|nr:sigma-70 family RNA polymerase sigma factor [Acidobacteriota bacterium]
MSITIPALSPSASSPRQDASPATSAAHPEDAALVGRLLAGDEAAFAGLVEQYHGRLVRLALAFVADRATAEEVVQDTWLAMLTGLRSFEGRSGLKTWIFSILTNRAKTRGHREKSSVPFSAFGDGHTAHEPAVAPARFTAAGSWSAAPEPWIDETPETLLLRGEVRTLIERAIAGLPPAQRAVLTLRDVEGVASADVCNILGIRETNQRVLLHRARSRIRAALEQHVRRDRC